MRARALLAVALLAASGGVFGCAASDDNTGAGGAAADAALSDASGGEIGSGGNAAAGAAGRGAQGGSAGRDAGAGGAGGAGGASGAGGDAGAGFTSSVVISDPQHQSFVPVVAARAGGAIVAWHDFVGAESRVVYSIVKNGVPGPLTPLSAATLTGPKRPSVAVTPSGYVLAYQANDGTSDLVRAVELDAAGAVLSGPVSISTPGTAGEMPHVATNSSGEEAFAWTDGTAHHFALRGPGETVGPTPVGTTLLSTGTLNFPRIALDDSGRLFLAYRDGGVQTSDWDVLLVVRPSGGSFGAPVDVSKSPGLLSDDISLCMESDGTLDIAWVDQNPSNVNAFEVEHARRAPGGTISAPARYGTQNLWAWTPSIVAGAVTAWATGPQSFGPMFLAAPGKAPEPLLPSETGGQTALARGPNGALHFVFTDLSTPRRVHYAYFP